MTTKDQIRSLQERLVRHTFFLHRGEGELLKLTDENFHRLVAENLVLDRATIVNCHFTNSNFAGTSFQNAQLSDTEFAHCGLRECDFRGAKMQMVRIAYSDARKSNLSSSLGAKVVLSADSDPKQNLNAWPSTDLSDSDFADADLTGAVLCGALLRGANLTGANLDKADLRGADLSGACLTGVRLTDAMLEGANLDGAVFPLDDLSRMMFHEHPAFRRFEADRTKMLRMIDDHAVWARSSGRSGTQANFHGRVVRGIDFSGRNLAAVDFSNATISASRFDKASLASANFRNATIRSTSFAGADLRASDFSDARLTNCCFAGTDFSGLEVEGYEALVASKWAQAHFIRCEFSDAKVPAALPGQAKLDNSPIPQPDKPRFFTAGPRLPVGR